MSDENQTQEDHPQDATLLPHQKEMMQSLLEKETAPLEIDVGAGSSTYVEVDPKASSGSLADGIPGTSNLHIHPNQQVQEFGAAVQQLEHPLVLPTSYECTTNFLPDGTPIEPAHEGLPPNVPIMIGDKGPGSIRSIYVGSGEELELRITEDSTGKCIRVAYYAGDSIRKIVWEPARTWSRN